MDFSSLSVLHNIIGLPILLVVDDGLEPPKAKNQGAEGRGQSELYVYHV